MALQQNGLHVRSCRVLATGYRKINSKCRDREASEQEIFSSVWQ